MPNHNPEGIYNGPDLIGRTNNDPAFRDHGSAYDNDPRHDNPGHVVHNDDGTCTDDCEHPDHRRTLDDWGTSHDLSIQRYRSALTRYERGVQQFAAWVASRRS